MNKKILGLDVGSNSLGWALLEESNGEISNIVDIGCRIFNKAVEEKVPTPKNAKRREMRMGRRIIQRRSRRKQRMLNYLVSFGLLPKELQGHPQPEIILNALGDPYELRTKALDSELTPYEFGRVLLHMVARRGFLSSKKLIAGDLVDDPDAVAYLNALDNGSSQNSEESAFKEDIASVRKAIDEANVRTLGEYLHKLKQGECKRNRHHSGGHLRTDRTMYQDELELIWLKQHQYFTSLPDDFMADNKGIKEIIFYQRPLKLNKDRIGKCSLEPKNNRASIARLEAQRFRYLQDINILEYFDRHTDQWVKINKVDRQKLTIFFEHHPKITISELKRQLGLDKFTKLNLEAKNLKGNTTAFEIRSVLSDIWDDFLEENKKALVEDLLSIKKKSALKSRLINHWKIEKSKVVKLCLLEFEPGHSNHSLKAINNLLPFLEQGLIYSDARIKAGYEYEQEKNEPHETLGAPPKTSNPIVNKGMHELRRVINAISKQYGKPDAIRIEMARELEMNTQQYKAYQAKQARNQKDNEKAVEAYQELGLGKFPGHNDKIKYRLWQEQNCRCVYSGKSIPLNAVFTANVEIDHILPYKKSLDDSYMNKVLCFSIENRKKGDKTPKDAWGSNEEKWNQITQEITRWKGLESKVNRFYKTEEDLLQRDFIASQLIDTRYIAKLALKYVSSLGCDVTTSKGSTTAWLRRQWGLNNIISRNNSKDRSDHRHHAIDAAVIACVDRSLYRQINKWAKNDEQKLKLLPPYSDFRKELGENIKRLIVSHAPQRKLSGGLHEETGAGYVEKHGGLVYRKRLASDFTEKNARSILDNTIKEIVLEHLAIYGNDAKKAFSEGIVVYHKDGRTPIKRVRILQSSTTLKKLERSKFGIKDKFGKIFKWMSYGNIHHLEIMQHKETGQYKSEFVTMMQASHRAKGIKNAFNPEGIKQPIIKKHHGDDWEFIFALHINDLVSINKGNGDREFYRVQVLDRDGGRLELRLHSAATLKEKNEHIRKSVSVLMKEGLKLHKINAIGIFTSDQENHRH